MSHQPASLISPENEGLRESGHARLRPEADIDRAEQRPQHSLMKLLIPLVMALAAACSDGQTISQSKPDGGVQRLATTAQPKVALTGRVTDAADIIDAGQEAALSQQLKELEQATGHQMVIVTVTTLGGREVAAFTRELANAWGIGRAEQDDGIVLLVAPNERKVRIEIGYGLERTLPDPLCQKIIDDHILPRFRKDDLPGGIGAGASALIDQLR